MKKELIKLAKIFNKNNIKWAQGGLSLLESYGIINNNNIIDIIIKKDDLDKALVILQHLGEEQEVKNNDIYTTKGYHEFVIGNVEVHLICDLGINNNGVINYQFSEDMIKSSITINNVKIHNTHIIDWYVIFNLINDNAIIKKICGSKPHCSLCVWGRIGRTNFSKGETIGNSK